MTVVLEDLAQIDAIFVSFPPTTHKYLATHAYGTGEQTVAFEVENKRSKMLIPLHLCRDLFPSAPSLSVDVVRFALNTKAEIEYLLSNHGDKLLGGTLKFLQAEAALVARPLLPCLRYSVLRYSKRSVLSARGRYNTILTRINAQ